jgi:hypothetical protein
MWRTTPPPSKSCTGYSASASRSWRCRLRTAHRALRRARHSNDAEEQARAIAEAREQAAKAVELYEFSDAGWVALAGAEAAAGDLAAASEAARRALLLNPVLKRYSVIPETGLGIEPQLLFKLLEDARFRKVWDALPGEDRIQQAPDSAEAAR